MSITSEFALAMQTPAMLARWYTGGRWKLTNHHAVIDREMMLSIRGIGPRIVIIEAPPRHGKSEYISRFLSAWHTLRWPDQRTAIISYGGTFAKRWGRASRAIVSSVGSRIGVSISKAASAASEWETNHGGGVKTAGTDGDLTGRGFNLLIVDDLIKNDRDALSEAKRNRNWDWWQSTAATRLEPDALSVVMATRWHDDDIIGRILKQADEIGEPVKHLRFAALREDDGTEDPLGREIGEALWPERWTADKLQRIKRRSDPFWWNALYQQRPTRHGSVEFLDGWFSDSIWVDRVPICQSAVIALDPSKGKDSKRGDYSSFVWIGWDGRHLYVDSLIDRMPVPRMVREGYEFARARGCERFGIEANQFQDLLADPFDDAAAEFQDIPLDIALIHNSVNKTSRIQRLGTPLARGLFRFLRTPSNKRLVSQLKEFPHGLHDDGPDALEMGLRLLKNDRAEVARATEVLSLE